MIKKTGILLVNLGTPDSASNGDVFKYLNEFLTDGRVIDYPWLPRQILVRGIIVPLRYKNSAKTYREIWDKDRGSPLLYHLQDLTKKVNEKLNADEYVVEYAMRYQNPSLEIEVPEIFDGLIVVKKIVREPGERAKVAVESYDDRIDPVGACVGMKGSRIHGIVRELKNENIDVINFTNNTQLLIQRSLTPAKITNMELNQENKVATVWLKPDQVSLAIGRRGVNIKLAQDLTDYEINVFRDNEGEEDDYDIDLDEFTDEIEEWVIDELKRVGCDTARSVLDLTAEELERRTDLEKETINDVRKVLQAEFDKE